ncbi:hypothetical protein [Bartonella sp. CB189]|uniref:hypothetical protein n=1 Tax=Bartonella sp. CB189 TaxID=3112254 RepID=UPI003FA60BF1
MIMVILIGNNSVLASGCAEIGRKVAAQRGGVLVRSTSVIQDGRNMCMVVVVVPARDDKKLRRMEVLVPAY